jgi:hypothetical protein
MSQNPNEMSPEWTEYDRILGKLVEESKKIKKKEKSQNPPCQLVKASSHTLNPHTNFRRRERRYSENILIILSLPETQIDPSLNCQDIKIIHIL